MKFPHSEFWTYSTQIYQLPAVKDNCLNLQNLYQADVNILLYCCWLGEKKIRLSENEIQTLIKISTPWQKNILIHLRAARKTLKTSMVIIPDELREETQKNICEMELNAERMHQLALEKAINLKKKSVNKKLNTIDCALENLNSYCQQLETLSSTGQIISELESITQAIFTDNKSADQALTSAQATG